MINDSQIASAVRVLAKEGFTLSPPAADSLEYVSVGTLQELLEVGKDNARRIASKCPNTLYLEGGDIRVPVGEVKAYLDTRKLKNFEVSTNVRTGGAS